MADSERIANWLEKKGTQILLEKLAKAIASDLRHNKILPPFLESSATNPEDVLPVLKSELALFILDDRARIQALVVAGDSNFSRYLRHAFINHCKDLVRTSGLDPLRYFRKRSGEVLRQSARIHTSLKNGRFTVFSLHGENEEAALPSDLELCSIPLPGRLSQGLDYTVACKKENLLDLAVHFWEKLSAILHGRRVWVDLKDFVNWVACYVPMFVTTAPEESADYPAEPVSEKPGTRAQTPCLSEVQPLPRPADEQLDTLVSSLAARLDKKDKAVFYYRYFQVMSWDDVARRTGFSGPSGPSYRYAGVIAQLKSFLREWPGLSPEDEDLETMGLFWDKLHAVLKEALPES
jgi:hypothetical protein